MDSAGPTVEVRRHVPRAVDAAPLTPIEVARLKIDLLASGLKIGPDVREEVVRYGKPRLRVRSGSCGGLDVVLPGGIYVNCPVDEHFAQDSPYELVGRSGELFIQNRDFGTIPVSLVPCPAYYERTDRRGLPLSRIGQLCSDRLGIGLTNNCYYWRSAERRCKFCSIGRNLVSEQRDKDTDQVVEVAAAAYSDPVAPARHVLLGGGTPDGADGGARRIAQAARALKERWDHPIYAMIVPPADDADIDLLRESGVDELGMNLELYDPAAAEAFIPGKWREIGFDRYLRALEHAVRVFGPINTRSIMIVGLEDPEATVVGVELLASMGVMPILSPFRPMTGTELEDHPRPSGQLLWEICTNAAEAAGRYGIPLGPTCIPCQSNTLTVPGHAMYRYY